MTTDAAPAPVAVATMLAGELATRLDALSTAIESDRWSRCAHERARIEALLKALEGDAPMRAHADDGNAGPMFRTIGRLVALAIAHADAGRCRQARILLTRLG